MRLRDVMSTEIVTASPDTSFSELVDLLISNDISGVPIVDDDGLLVGIVTEADLVSKEAFGGHRRRVLELLADFVAGGETRWALKGRGRTAAELMSRQLVKGHAHDRVQTAARQMVEAEVKRLPVVDAEGRLVGIVSRSDLLRLLHRTDEELHGAIIELFADPLRAPERADLHFGVEEGEVTVTGTVEFPHDLSFVSALVWSVPGVVDVHNMTTARNPEPRLADL